jgi:hypothetical protein
MDALTGRELATEGPHSVPIGTSPPRWSGESHVIGNLRQGFGSYFTSISLPTNKTKANINLRITPDYSGTGYIPNLGGCWD